MGDNIDARKSAAIGEISFSITLWHNRLSVYRFIGGDYCSIDMPGTVDDFNQFDETRPGEWFDVAAKMLKGRGEK